MELRAVDLSRRDAGRNAFNGGSIKTASLSGRSQIQWLESLTLPSTRARLVRRDVKSKNEAEELAETSSKKW
jgi:hypothetical protein